MNPQSTTSKPSAPQAVHAASARPIWWFAAGALALVATTLAVIWTRPGDDPDKLWAKAQGALQAGQLEQAEEALARLSLVREPTVDDWLLRARVAVAGKRHDDAIEALGHISDDARLAGGARQMAGQIELRRNRMRLAESYLRRAIELDPSQDQARRELIYIYGMQLRRDAIAEQFRELAKRTPLTFDQVFLWCLTRGSKWQAEQHSETLRSFVETDPEDRWSRLALSDSYVTLGRLDEAEKVLDPLPDSDPEAVERRARIALARGEIERVERFLDGAPESHAGLAWLRGSLALRKRDAQAAIRHYQTAKALEPNNRDTLIGLARAYTLAGDTEKAGPYREASRRLEELSTLMQYASTGKGKEDPELPMKLGRACEEIGRIPEARAWYRLVIARDPLNRDAQQALYRLETPEAALAPGSSD